jgi:hypothetical protein
MDSLDYLGTDGTFPSFLGKELGTVPSVPEFLSGRSRVFKEIANRRAWNSCHCGLRSGFLLVSQAASGVAGLLGRHQACRWPALLAQFGKSPIAIPSGYFRSRAVDTFTPCPFSPILKTPVPVAPSTWVPLELIHGYVSKQF